MIFCYSSPDPPPSAALDLLSQWYQSLRSLDEEVRWIDSLESLNRDRPILVPESELPRLGESGLRSRGRLWLVSCGSRRVLARTSAPLDLRSAGFEAALVPLPSIASLLRRHFDLESKVIPPCAPNDGAGLDGDLDEREPLVLLHATEAYRAEGLPDLPLVKALLQPLLAEHGWTLEDLEGLDREAIRQRLAKATFLIDLDGLEGFRPLLLEAMASGCAPVTFFGPSPDDPIADREATVGLTSSDVYQLIERTMELVNGDDPQGQADGLRQRRRRGIEIAARFPPAQAARSLKKVLAASAS